jgi:conjugative transfer protein CagX
MKPYIGALFALAAIGGAAQTTNFGQINHIETALNHLTVIDFGEPVVTVAVADPDSIQIERHDDKIFIKPLKDGVSTNLFVWTASRQLAYEIDPAGDLAKMDVMIRSAPPAQQKPNHEAASLEPSDQQIQKIASLILTQALMGSENIVRESGKVVTNGVSVELEQVFRSKDALYIRYTITNQTALPFRITAPDVHEAEPTGQPISLVALRNHQLSPHTSSAFKAKPGESIPVINAGSVSTDIPPGQKSTGVVTIRGSKGNQPQLYRLHFGNSQGGVVTADAVL